MFIANLIGFAGDQYAIKNLGVFGVTFPIKERSLMEVLREKLQSEQGRVLLQAFEERLKKLTEESRSYIPKPVESVTPTTKHKSYLFNPAIVLPHDLKDHEGNRFYKAGDLINPLDHITLSKDYLFIDGDKPKQIEWAKGYQKQKQVMIVLVKGDPITVMKDHQIQVFFDQEGAMVQRFKLKHVPCSIVQDGKNLRITELVENELKEALQ
jgi:conjugal transfer pilus assembly protein TraW